jgi:hypothetical protein
MPWLDTVVVIFPWDFYGNWHGIFMGFKGDLMGLCWNFHGYLMGYNILYNGIRMTNPNPPKIKRPHGMVPNMCKSPTSTMVFNIEGDGISNTRKEIQKRLYFWLVVSNICYFP